MRSSSRPRAPRTRGAADIEEYNAAEDSWQPLSSASLPAAATSAVADDAASEWSFVSKWTLEWDCRRHPPARDHRVVVRPMIAQMLQEEERASYHRTFRTNEAVPRHGRRR